MAKGSANSVLRRSLLYVQKWRLIGFATTLNGTHHSFVQYFNSFSYIYRLFSDAATVFFLPSIKLLHQKYSVCAATPAVLCE